MQQPLPMFDYLISCNRFSFECDLEAQTHRFVFAESGFTLALLQYTQYLKLDIAPLKIKAAGRYCRKDMQISADAYFQGR